MQDIIYIKDLHVKTLIGILPHERLTKQTLILDLDLYTDFQQAVQTEHINDALNYAAIVQEIEEFAAQADFQLIETFATQLIETLFSQWKLCQQIDLTLQKPSALIQTQHVGLKISRIRTKETL